MKFFPASPALLLLLSLAAAVPAAPPSPVLPERAAPERVDSTALGLIRALNKEGQEVRAVAVVFLGLECPLSRAAVPALNALHDLGARARANGPYRGLRVLGVVPRETTGDAHARRGEAGIRFAVAGDPDLVLARGFGAHVTPEVVLVDTAGRVLYRGAVDDRAADLRRRRPRPTRAWLDSAAAQWASGRPLEPASTRAVGCFIE